MLRFARKAISNRASEKGKDMDMTPMVDVTFLLLIFFMVTASFSIHKTIQSPVAKLEDPSPNSIEQPPESDQVVTVQVDEFSSYNIITQSWDQLVGSKQDLIVALDQANDQANLLESAKLRIEAHEDSTHGAVVTALDAGREAHFENFEVNTVEQFD